MVINSDNGIMFIELQKITESEKMMDYNKINKVMSDSVNSRINKGERIKKLPRRVPSRKNHKVATLRRKIKFKVATL